jgi:predicted PhzF superfamily epimerase YddE/YHI9
MSDDVLLEVRRMYVVDAFTDRPFAGNPAAVCVLDAPADETWMRQVACEMNLSETAFLWPVGDGYSLRWLTPAVEVDLCGHATLASAHVLWETGALERSAEARFTTRGGTLVCRQADAWVEMDFPALPVSPCEAPPGLDEALGTRALRVGDSGMDLLVEVMNETVLSALSPDMNALSAIPKRGVIVTCRSDTAGTDFVSRFFAPAAGINEDPVTGSSHCALGPYWAAQIGKTSFAARQLSARGGVMKVEVCGERVRLSGQAVTVSRVEMMG